MNLRKVVPAVETTVVWLFLLQASRVLFSSLFGVFYDALFDASLPLWVMALDLVLVVLAMLTPLLLRPLGRQDGTRTGAVRLVLIARIPLLVEQPTLRMVASIVLLAGAAFYVAHLLSREPQRLMVGFVAGLGADQLVRALDYTYDPTLRPGGLPLVVGVVVIAALLNLYLSRQRLPAAPDRPDLSAGLVLGAGLFLEVTLLSLPNALSRWSSLDYGWTAPLLLLVTLLPLAPTVRAFDLYLAILLWPAGGILSVALVLLCLGLAAVVAGPAAALLLLVAQLALLFLISNVVINRRKPHRNKEGQKPRLPGLEVSLGMLLFLLFSFAFAFTFTYPYTLPFFRGLGTLVLLLAGLVAVLPAVNMPLAPEIGPIKPWQSALGTGVAVALAVVCAFFTKAPALVDTPAGATLRLATYNIHYGFNTDWVFNLEQMAETLESNAVDVAVLQEVDAARVTSLSVDNALWLSQRLGMHTVFQPTLEKLSGIALLSRYPLDASDGKWLTSALEQTAIVHGAVRTSSGPLHAYGVWLGLRPAERATQLAEALDYIGFASPAVLGGDFNAAPGSPVYARLVEEDLTDPFSMSGSGSYPTSPAIHPTERIDYVWLRGVAPNRAWVPDSTASDHRMVVVEIQMQP